MGIRKCQIFCLIPLVDFFGASTALVVALKQINPEREWKLFTLSFRAKHLPSIYLLTGLILFAFPLTKSAAFEFSFFGLIVSWIYLRYFQFHDGTYGDHTPQFKFSTLFPEVLQPFCELLSRLCCCYSGKKKTSSIALDSDFNSSKDADRQRKLALKVLEDKFQNMKELPLPADLKDHQPDKKPEIIIQT